jgi:hypothetical protein
MAIGKVAANFQVLDRIMAMAFMQRLKLGRD